MCADSHEVITHLDQSRRIAIAHEGQTPGSHYSARRRLPPPRSIFLRLVEESENHVAKSDAEDCAQEHAIPEHRALLQDLARPDLSLAAKNLVLGANNLVWSIGAASIAKH